jgi:hypothetical protein
VGEYKDITPGKKRMKRLYTAIMLWFVGRSIQAASKVDQDVKKEFDELPDQFVFSLGVTPDGPRMLVGKDINGNVKYLGSKPKGKKINVDMTIKNLEAAILLFTFQESTAISSCHDRLTVDGDIPSACAVVRILDMVEVYLLPKIIAKLAVKRYPQWTTERKLLGRTKIYLRAILGI